MRTLAGTNLSQGAARFGVLAFRGADAAKFLQGQLSADVEKLASGDSTLAGLLSPQGRVIALLALVRASTDEILAILPAELIPAVTTRLAKLVFRAKVRIEDVSAGTIVLGAHLSVDGTLQARWGSRFLLLAPVGEAVNSIEAETSVEALASWERADVAEGLPQVYAATSEAFVAQMLNLDLVGAIAFDKGCYTGQEVVARAHYRGRVKRRLQRWRHDDDAPIAPGDSARTAGGRSLSVVRVAPRQGPGAQEVLAIGTFAADAPETAGATAGVTLDGPLPLPYALPD
jgi:tRNA-modifying protein YgfZ